MRSGPLPVAGATRQAFSEFPSVPNLQKRSKNPLHAAA
jgi:hypothetical protein